MVMYYINSSREPDNSYAVEADEKSSNGMTLMIDRTSLKNIVDQICTPIGGYNALLNRLFRDYILQWT